MKRKIVLILIMVVLVMSISLTYAIYKWSSPDTLVSFPVEGMTITYNGGANISANLIPTATKASTGNIKKTITVKANTDVPVFNLYLDVNSLDSGLKHQSFRWELYKETMLVNVGNFANVSATDTIDLLRYANVTSNEDTYYLYIWVDGTNYTNPEAMDNKTFKFTLRADAYQNDNLLPNGYTKVLYLQTAGEEYINTGITGDYVGDFDISFIAASNRQLIGQNSNASYYWGSDASNQYELGGGQVVTGSNTTIRNRVVFMNETINGMHLAILSVGSNTIQRTNTNNYVSSFTIGSIRDEIDYYSKNKIYGSKFYQNNKLVRYLIPCYRNSDEVLGMYDIVNNVFYSNGGSGNFISGYELPAEYVNVSYLQTTGSQYIDTGISGNYTGVFDIAFLTKASRQLLGQNTSASYYWGSDASNQYELGGGQAVTGSDTTIRNKVTFTTNVTGSSHIATLTVGDTTITRTSSSSATSDTFKLSSVGSSSYASSVKIYGAKFYQNDILVRNFVPVKRVSDQVLGMYDLVKKTFYVNVGSGTFTEGE